MRDDWRERLLGDELGQDCVVVRVRQGCTQRRQRRMVVGHGIAQTLGVGVAHDIQVLVGVGFQLQVVLSEEIRHVLLGSGARCHTNGRAVELEC